MKVVLFCGGQGLRLRDYGENVPKPMVPIGYRPVLWHVMRWYAEHGHNEFILCLGHGADVIKNYFLNYDETVTNDFVLRPSSRAADGRRASDAGAAVPRDVELVTNDTSDWSITFADTGRNANIGERLAAVRPYLGEDEFFLANYADGVSDAPLPQMIDDLRTKHAANGTAATFLKVRPSQSFHCVESDADGGVRGLHDVTACDIWINGGYFVLHRDVFNYMRRGEELVGPTFERLIQAGRLTSWRHEGFFAAMDTFKEQRQLQQLHDDDAAPWEIWNTAKRSLRDRVASTLPMKMAETTRVAV